MKKNAFHSIINACTTTFQNFLKICSAVYYRHQQIFHKIGMVILVVYSCFYIAYLYVSDIFYYTHKDSNKQFSERHIVHTLPFETRIQASIRKYLSGSNNYYGRIPFSGQGITRLLNLSHDAENKNIVLNWDTGFYHIAQDPWFEQDVASLIKVLQKNYSIEKLYFLVDGKITHHIYFQNQDLGKGIELKKRKNI